MDPLIGKDIGRYHIIELLGEGGMAIVYKAFDTHLECEVAMKFIRMERLTPELAGKTLKRFEREARVVARLSHSHIVRVTDYGEYQGVPYLVMPCLTGGTLKQFSGYPMPYQKAAKLVAAIAHALEYAHAHGVLHRDVKPSNILLSQDGQPMLSDFGVAKILTSEDENLEFSLTGTGVGIGTPEYMSPEQGQGLNIDERSDIYSLGIVFYELVTGRKPFIADTPLAVVIKQINNPLPRPRTFVQDLPRKVEDVIFKALAKKPEDRYQNAAEFASSLAKLILKPEKNSYTTTRERKQSLSENTSISSTIKTATIDSPQLIPKNPKVKNPFTKMSSHRLFFGFSGIALIAIVTIILLMETQFSRKSLVFSLIPIKTQTFSATRSLIHQPDNKTTALPFPSMTFSSTSTNQHATPTISSTRTPISQQPTKTITTSTVIFSPTPTQNANPLLYDDFNNTDYDYSYNHLLWSQAGDNLLDVMQNSGTLQISDNGTKGGEYVLQLKEPTTRKIEQIQFLEAQIKLNSYKGTYLEFAKIQISANVNGHSWWTQCRMQANNGYGIFLCDVYTVVDNIFNQEYATEAIDISLNNWYTTRIEINPQTMELRYYLNNSHIGTYIPKDSTQLLTSYFVTQIGVWSDGQNTSFSCSFDNVQITPIKK